MDQEVRTSLAVSCLVWRLSRAVLSPRLGGRGCWGWVSMVTRVLGKMAVCGVVMLLLLCCILYTGHTCPSTAQHQCPGQLESRSSTDLLQFLLRRSVMLHMLG